jgi:hypothetical protein
MCIRGREGRAGAYDQIMTPADDDTSRSDPYAEFCRELNKVRPLYSGVRRAALERAVRQLREGADIYGILAELGIPVTEPPLYGRGASPTPVGSPGPPVRGGYLCPVGACLRVEERRAGEGPPECLVHERVLTFVPDA